MEGLSLRYLVLAFFFKTNVCTLCSTVYCAAQSDIFGSDYKAVAPVPLQIYSNYQTGPDLYDNLYDALSAEIRNSDAY